MPTGLIPELAVDRKIEGIVVDFQNSRSSPPRLFAIRARFTSTDDCRSY
jgi:hypothetical protein